MDAQQQARLTARAVATLDEQAGPYLTSLVSGETPTHRWYADPEFENVYGLFDIEADKCMAILRLDPSDPKDLAEGEFNEDDVEIGDEFMEAMYAAQS